MKTEGYDEFQQATQHKIAFQTLLITFVLIMLNGYTKLIYGDWAANPMIEMLVMIYIPAMYFTLTSITKNAYLRKKDHPVVFIVLMGFAFILSSASVISSVTSGMFLLVENGQLSDQLGSVFLTIFAGSTTAALFIRRVRNKKMLENEND
ncbi:hypothetical protein ACXYMX_05020 [Sporosarcina sp. CAU 1771]